MKALGDGPHVVVGTPGRVQDMIQRRVLKTDNMKMFVLDEADEMLSVCDESFLRPLSGLTISLYSVVSLSRYTTSFSCFLNQLRSFCCQPLCPKMSLRSPQNSCVILFASW